MLKFFWRQVDLICLCIIVDLICYFVAYLCHGMLFYLDNIYFSNWVFIIKLLIVSLLCITTYIHTYLNQLKCYILDVALNICNDKTYGYIMVPLDKKDSLETDQLQLTNLKVESIYDESLLTSDKMFDRYMDLPVMDKMGFDEVYMINLLRRPDRKQKMQLCFEQLGVDVKLIEAVDGK